MTFEQHSNRNYPLFASRIHRNHDSKIHTINSFLHMHKEEMNQLSNQQIQTPPPLTLSISNHHKHMLCNNSPSLSVESCADSTTSKSYTSQQSSDSEHSLYSSSPKTSQIQKNHNHHHHSIQELIRHFGKSVRNHWKSEGGYRRASCSEDSTTCKLEEEFRGRSKSLDGTFKKKVLTDCEATYRIYESILKEGIVIHYTFKIKFSISCL